MRWVFPASAGMNRGWWTACYRLACVPRQRGDEP